MEPPASSALTRAVIISDAKRGHENQSRVIARMLGDLEPLVLHLRPRIEELPLRLRLALWGAESLSQLRAAELVRRNLQPEHPDVFRRFAHSYREARGNLRLFTISTGTPPATYNLVAARMLGATAIVNMTPSLLPRSRFALNIVPEHDVQRGKVLPDNVVTASLALGYHDSPPARLLAARIASDNGFALDGGYLGVALGGPTSDIPYPEQWCEDILRQLLAAAAKLSLRLLITTSRRTPRGAADAIARLVYGNPLVAYYLDAHTDPLNPLPAFYELSQALVITADSYSMVSEAIHAGHTPLVLAPPGAKRNSKVLRSLRELHDKQLIQLLDGIASQSANRVQQALATITPRKAPNGLYDELAQRVRQRLGLPGEQPGT